MSGERVARSEGSAVGKATRSLVGRLVEVQRNPLNRPDVCREPKDRVHGGVAVFGAFQNLNYLPGYPAFLECLMAAFESLYTLSLRPSCMASAMATCSATSGFVVRTEAQLMTLPSVSMTETAKALPSRYAAASTKLAAILSLFICFSILNALALRRPAL